MFTGIVTDVGRVIAYENAKNVHARIATHYPLKTITTGASIACQGVCLTVTDKGEYENGTWNGSWFDVDISEETCKRTLLGAWGVGTNVNLEQSLALGAELGGHLVTGHVDGLGVISSIEEVGNCYRVECQLPDSLLPFVAEKGSIAIDGISLTVNAVKDTSCQLMLIPHTWSHTTCHTWRVGSHIHIEIDTIARYVARMLQFQRNK